MRGLPLVSVVIPVYNLEAYIGEAIDSVLNQDFKDLEVILVDDGSTDRSRKIITDYQQRFPGRVYSLLRGHQGAAAARNAGIAASRGEWIAFLDGDDIWKPQKIARQMQAAAENPAIDMLATAVEKEGSREIIPKHNPDPKQLRIELLTQGCIIPLSSVMVRRATLDDERFDERLESAQDLDLYYRIADRVHFHFITEALVIRRERPHSISDPHVYRFMQLHRQYLLTVRELRRLRRIAPDVYPKINLEMRASKRQMALQAAYESLFARNATLPRRVRLALITMIQKPFPWKSIRFLMQAFLPLAVNRRISYLRHRKMQ